ncbi:MAG: ABC-F family ATP-binding cassette domain-containing protein [Patescibacteria group bacterium]
MVLAEVNLPLETTTKIETLSGGQKTKVGLAKLLLTEPTTLLLDEPTNNLDLTSIEWLEQFIQNFDGNVFVISHDRSFLDATVTKIFELDPITHAVIHYTGNYSQFVLQKKKIYEKDLQEYADFVEKKKAMETWIKKKQQELSVHSSPKGGRQLEAMKKRYEREIEKNSLDKPQEYTRINIQQLGEETYAKKVIFHINDLYYGNLFSCKQLTITGGDRIHLQGNNGTGKTTFVKILLNQIQNVAGTVQTGTDIKIGYFAQGHDVLNKHKTVLQEFQEKTGLGEEEKVRKILAKFLFKGNHVFTKVSHLSQGEKVKLIIAELIHQHNHFLILDEPTNHLDIESREVLEHALNEYEGGFLIISHDRYFVEQVDFNKKLILKDGKLL